jgi:Cytochrome P450
VESVDVYDPDNLAKAVTLNRTLEETLRLTPSLYFLPRRATVDTWVETADGRRMFIPQGTHVVLDVWHANRCEDFWGKALTGYPADAFARSDGTFLPGTAARQRRSCTSGSDTGRESVPESF